MGGRPFVSWRRNVALVLAPALVAVLSAACMGATDGRLIAARPTERTTTTGVAAPVSVPACVAGLTVEQKAGQLLMVLVGSPDDAGDLVAAGQVAGYALVGNQGPDTAAEIAAVAARSKLPVLAAGDEEGGTVQRLRELLGELPAAATLAAEKTPDEAAATFGDYATKMKGLGLNMNFGPSLDVGGGSGLGTRSCGASVDRVAAYGIAVMEAVQKAGLIPVVKHWPGIGGGKADPHVSESPVASIAKLRARDLVPFERAMGAGVPAIMVSHAIVPNLTQGLPASLSRAAITEEIRRREAFGGLVVTDDLGMGAVSVQFDAPSAAVVAIAAGADLALLPQPKVVGAAHLALISAINDGRIPMDQVDQSVARVLAAKGIVGACPA